MQIDTPRYRGQFDYDNAYTRGTVRISASDGLPVLLADQINEPGIPNLLGPGLTLDDQALCDMTRLEVRAQRTAVVDGCTRRWRVSVYWHASLEEWIAGVLPAYELLHQKLHDGGAGINRVRQALDHALRHTVLRRQRGADTRSLCLDPSDQDALCIF